MKKTLLLLMILFTTAYAGNPDYESGYQAMQNQDWYQSYEFFKRAAKDKEITDASYFWQGYVLFKLNKKTKAEKVLNKLIKQFPDSRWTDDGKLLLFENSKLKVDLNDVKLDEELRLFAIQQIYFNNPKKGLPLLQEFLEKSQNKATKVNALNILGISESDTALQILHKFIIKEKNEDLINQAIQILSLRNNPSSNKILMELYKSNTDKTLKGPIIHSFIHSDEKNTLVELLKNEGDKDARMQMINILGIKGANAELKEFYSNSKNVDEKLAIIHALAIAGDSEFIINLIKNEEYPNIKSAAIRSMIIIDDEQAQGYLLELYTSNQSQEIKQEIIQAFIGIGIDSKLVLDLIKSESDEKNKIALLQVLMAQDDSDSLLQVYTSDKNEEIRASVIHQLGAMGSNNELIQLFEISQKESQQQIVRALGMSNSTDSTQFLQQLFKTGNSRMQQAVIQSFIVQDDTQSLIKLLKQETDIEMKKQLIKAIGITNSDALDNILETDKNTARYDDKTIKTGR